MLLGFNLLVKLILHSIFAQLTKIKGLNMCGISGFVDFDEKSDKHKFEMWYE